MEKNYAEMKDLGRKIKIRRHLKGISDKEMAQACGKDIRTYRNYEAGKTEMRLEVISVLAKKLGCTCDSLAYDGEKEIVAEAICNFGEEKMLFLMSMLELSPEDQAKVCEVIKTLPRWR